MMYLVVVSMISGLCAIVQQGPTSEVVLPSLNLYNQTAKLLNSTAMQRQLQLSEEQIAFVERSFEEQKKEIADVFRVRRSQRISLKANDLLNQIRSETNTKYRLILEKSLSGFQIEQLQRISVQARFPTAEKPFQDREVLSYCGASDKERDDLNKLIKDLGADLYKRLSVARTNSIEELGESLRLLNPTQMKALVNLVGNKFFPEIALEEDSLDESIPFPSKVRSIFLLNCLVDDRELQKFLRLSDSQINKLVEIYAHFDQSQRESKGPTGLFERSSNEMLAVLNPTQKQGVLRSLMSYEFENDFVSVLGDPKVVAYLKLSEADESALKLLAETAAEKLKSKRSEINKAFFERLCESLSPKCGKIMRSLFGDCW